VFVGYFSTVLGMSLEKFQRWSLRSTNVQRQFGEHAVSHWFSSLAASWQSARPVGRSGRQAAVRLIMARCHTMHVAPIRPIITGCSSRAIGTESARCEPNYMQHSHSLFHIIQREIPLRWRKKRKNWSALSHTKLSHILNIYLIDVFFPLLL
jgi:hypothetical protein